MSQPSNQLKHLLKDTTEVLPAHWYPKEPLPIRVNALREHCVRKESEVKHLQSVVEFQQNQQDSLELAVAQFMQPEEDAPGDEDALYMQELMSGWWEG